MVRALRPALEVNGMTVTIANTGSDAIAAFDGGTWDALVVDLGLPDMDGKDVVRYCRARSDAAMFVISGRHLQAEVDAAHTAGATGFLHKPFRTSDLISRLKGAPTQ